MKFKKGENIFIYKFDIFQLPSQSSHQEQNDFEQYPNTPIRNKAKYYNFAISIA